MLVLFSMAVACGSLFGLAEAHDSSAHHPGRDKAPLLPPGLASQRLMCEHGKRVEIKPPL